MSRVVDAGLWDALIAYTTLLRGFFADDLVGIYLYGSVAYGAFDPRASDLDVAVLHRIGLNEGRTCGLAGAHERFGRGHPTDRLDVSFVPLRLVGGYGEDALPYYRDGRFRRKGGGDVNPVMWRTLHGRGVVVCGPPAAEIVPLVSNEELAENMRRNLAFLRRRMPLYVMMGTGETVFGVLSLCRALYTLRTGEIFGKVEAGRWALRNLNPRWRSLIERALVRYEGNDLGGIDVLLRTRAVAFAAHVARRPDREPESTIPAPQAPRRG